MNKQYPIFPAQKYTRPGQGPVLQRLQRIVHRSPRLCDHIATAIFLLLLAGSLTMAHVANASVSGTSAAVAKSFPRCASHSFSGVPLCTEEMALPAYSGVFHVRGTGVIRVESTRQVSGYFTSGGTRLEYLDPNSGQWGEPYYSQWAYGVSRYNWCRDGGGTDGNWSWQECMVTNADSHPLRLAAHAPRYYQPVGFDQFDGPMTMRLTFTPTESTLSDHLDQAGGAANNPYTIMHPAGDCRYGLPHYSVNTAFLNLVLEDADFGCQSFGLNTLMRRVWNMQPSLSGMFGNGWRFQYEASLLVQPDGHGAAELSLGSGQRYHFVSTERDATDPSLALVKFKRTTPGMGPQLSARLDKTSGIGTYALIDQRTQQTQVFEYAGEQSGGHLYRLGAIRDRNNNNLRVEYAGNGRIAQITDGSGRVTRFTYDGNRRCTAMQTFDGRTARFQYDDRGNLTQSIDLAGNVITYTYSAQNLPLTMTVAGKTTSFAYANKNSGEAYLASVTEPDGKSRHYAFVSDGETQVTEPGGRITTYANNSGRTTSIKNPLGQNVSTAHTPQLLPAKITDPLGRVTAMEYDANGNLTQHTDAAGQVTTYTYDADWNLTSVTNPLGQITRFEYDDRHNLIKETSHLGQVTAYQVDNKGQVTGITQPDGGRYTLRYDTHGNLTGITNPLGHTLQTHFDGQGLNPTALTDALGNTTGYSFDANRRLTAIRPADGTQILYHRDCCSLTSVTDGAGNTTQYQRDAAYRPTTITDPLGFVSKLAYTADGDLATATDPLGHSSQIGYDKTRRPAVLTDALGGKIQFSRDAVGNVTALTDERGKVTSMTYDTRDLLSAIKDPLGKSVSYTRDALGRITGITNARGESIGLVYDADGRLSEKRYQGTAVVQYVWDANNQLVSVSDPTGIKRFQRDAAGRVTRITYPDGKTIDFVYDANGNRTAVTYPDGLTATYTYDSLNRVASVSFAGNTLNLSYDAAGNLIGETRSNGVSSTYGYDAAHQLIRVSHKRGEAVIADISYTRNAAGLITRESGTWPLPAKRTFENATATHDDANAIVTWNSDSYTHDPDGNLTGISGSRSFAAQYDPENRPTAITRSGSTTQYAYDGLNNRVRGQSTSQIRNFYHDEHGTLLTDIDTTSNVVTHYIHAGSRLLAAGSAGKGYVFHHFDKTGNTLALTDTTGQVVGAFAYDTYGKVVARSGSAGTPFTYVGAYGVMEGAENLFFMRHRYYDAVTGRFIQRDPIGFAGGQTNLYAYAGNSVVGRIDPSGLGPFGWNLPFADAAPGSTMDQFLRKIFRQKVVTINGKPTLTLVEKAPGLYQRTFWSTPKPMPTTNPLNCPPTSSPSFGLTAARVYVVGYSAWAGWMLTGKLLQDIAQASGNEDLDLFGTAMIEAGVDPAAWIYAGRYYLGVIERLLEGPAPVNLGIPADAAHHTDYRGVKIFH